MNNGVSRGNRAARRRAVIAMSMATWTTACFTYVPPQAGANYDDRIIRIELNRDGTDALTSVLGNDVKAVSGRTRYADADSVVLDVKETTLTNRQVVSSTGATVTVRKDYQEKVEVQVLDRKRTGVMVAVWTVGAIIVAVAAKAVGSGGVDGGGGPPPPTTTRIPR